MNSRSEKMKYHIIDKEERECILAKKDKQNECTKANVSEKKLVSYWLEEWKYLNDYINKIDLGFQSSMVIIVTIFVGLIGFFSTSDKESINYCILLIPLGTEAILAYVSYQFRIVAIIRGHLAELEIKMNDALGENVYLWNSALVEMYMARNNLINQCMMLPIVVLFLVMLLFCFLISCSLLGKSIIEAFIFILYWLLILLFAIIIFVPFMQNEKIRKETMDSETIVQKYKSVLKGENCNDNK